MECKESIIDDASRSPEGDRGADGPESVRAKLSLRAFQAFRSRDFRILWIGAFTSTTGTWMQTVAQSWVVLSMTKSAFLLGVDAFLATAPMILFSLFGGVVADRVERRRILLVSQVAQMTLAFILAALIYSGKVEVWHIFALSFATGTAQAFGGPAYQALLPLLVPREDMPNAIALNSMQFNLARMIGPVLAGLALAALGPAACFALNGVSFIPVMLSLLAIRASFQPVVAKTRSIFGDIRAGFSFLQQRPAIRQLTLLAFVSTFFGIPLVTMLPVVAKSVFGFGATGYSWMMTASGAGSVAGALFVAARSHRTGRGRSALVYQLGFAVFLLIFASSGTLWISLIAVFFAGASLLGIITTVSSLVQLATTEEMRGRVMSIFMLSFRGGMPLGNLTAGWVADRASVSLALGANAVALGVISALFLMRRNRIREL
ncbi:MAG: MFS transporter [Thermoanaerobaculia bacterium]